MLKKILGNGHLFNLIKTIYWRILDFSLKHYTLVKIDNLFISFKLIIRFKKNYFNFEFSRMFFRHILILFVLSIVWIGFLIYFFYKTILEEHITEWIKDRERVRQLRWESEPVQGILHNMSEEGVLKKMTTVERAELREILAKEYPVWYDIYGKEMTYIPRDR